MRRWLVVVALAGCASKNAENQAPAADAAVETPAAPSLKVLSKSPVTSAEVEATRAFFGDIVIVRISGLAPHAAVTLRADTQLRGTFWSSTTTFEANDKGEVDTSRDAATSGYEGVDADGPLWSMVQTKDSNDAPELAVKFHAFVDDNEIASAKLDRYLTNATGCGSIAAA